MSDAKRLDVLQHALGVDRFGQGPQYRNHFVTDEGTTDYPHCMALVTAGLMVRREGNALSGGGDIFYVTQAGKNWMAANSPKPPKLNRAQVRYREFLAADSSLPFGEWLRRNVA